MRMDRRHACWSRALQKNDRSMRTLRQPRGLKKQAPVRQRDSEICIRLPLDNDAAAKAVIADGQVFDADVEAVALLSEIDQRGMPLRRIDQQLMTREVAADFGRGSTMSCDIDGTGHLERGRLHLVHGWLG